MANSTAGKGNTQEFVQKQLKKGFSKKEIKKALISAGHSEKKVDSVLSGISEGVSRPATEQKPKGSSNSAAIIILVISIIAIAAVAFVLLRSGESDLGMQEEETLTEEEVPTEPEEPPARRGPPTLVELCSETPTHYHETELAWLALATDNISYCDFLEETPLMLEGFSRDQCIIQFEVSNAFSTGDCNILDKPNPDYHTAFIMCQAAVDKTPNICGALTDISAKTDCNALFSDDVELCGSAQESIGATCWENFWYVNAHVNSDISLCQNMQDEELRSTCSLSAGNDKDFVMESIKERCFNEFPEEE